MMTRYLTPAKICLLGLASLYTESVVPSSSTIPILSFIVCHVLPSKVMLSGDESSSLRDQVVFPITALEDATTRCASGIPGRTVWDLLLKKLWSIDSFDALHVFFDHLSSLFPEAMKESHGSGTTQMPLSKASPLGSFIRRCQLEFTRLQFHDGVSLWRSYVAYRSSTLLQYKKRNSTVGSTTFDINLRAEHIGLGDPLAQLIYGSNTEAAYAEKSFSTEDVEKLLEHQVEQMQSGSIFILSKL